MVDYWNSLPNSIHNSSNLKAFIRSNLMKYLNQSQYLNTETDGNRMQWHAPIYEHPVTESIASNRDKGVRKIHESSLLLHYYQSHVDNHYKQGLLRTMLDRAYRFSSCWSNFLDECNRLKTAFSPLKYPKHVVNSTIKSFVHSKVCDQQRPLSTSKETDDTVRVVLPFKDQISADMVKEQHLSLKLIKHHHPACVCQPEN